MTLGFSHQSGTQVRPAAAGTVSKKEFERIVDLRCGRKKKKTVPGEEPRDLHPYKRGRGSNLGESCYQRNDAQHLG
jgi:hypothetical protein